MEGLIKDLVKVALGNKEEEESRDERSRATWAEVVSSGGDDDSGENKQQQCQQPSEHWRRPEIASSGGDDNYGDIRQSEYEKPSGHWGRPEVESAEVEGSGDNEGEWETVGKKHKKHGLHQKVPVDCWDGYKQDPSEQNYADEFDGESSIQPSEEELSDLSQTCNKLWDLDTNRLIPGKDYAIDCGEGKKVYDKEDMAPDNLFSRLADNVFRRPTFSRFLSLLDNYNPDQGCKEVVTSQEKHEQVAFVEEISRTAPVKYLHKYLVARGVASESYAEFKDMLRGLWFDLYARGGSCGSSSAFEHVFVGEIKNRGESEVSGFHNWIQFYLEEAKGRVDYQGYIFPRRRGEVPDSETQLLTIQFEWNGVLKSVSSSFVGVSPEFELALYTLCFFVGKEDNHVSLGPYYVNIKCYRLGDNRIGSVFPIAE